MVGQARRQMWVRGALGRTRALRLGMLACLALLGACHRQPDFDDRYAAAQKKIEATSQAIDARLAGPPAGTATEKPGGVAPTH